MKINEIQSLIKFVSKAGVSEVEIEKDGFKIFIKTEADQVAPQYIQASVPAPQALPAAAPAPAAPAAAPAPAAEAASAGEDTSKYIEVKAPMIGTFYRKANPESEVFVNVGDEIKPGQVICIIEAMKLFNEIESEVSGKIVKILVDDSNPVQYDQPLFLVDPS